MLAVDEYQDLGVALHRIVKRLAFDGVSDFSLSGMRISRYMDLRGLMARCSWNWRLAETLSLSSFN